MIEIGFRGPIETKAGNTSRGRIYGGRVIYGGRAILYASAAVYSAAIVYNAAAIYTSAAVTMERFVGKG